MDIPHNVSLQSYIMQVSPLEASRPPRGGVRFEAVGGGVVNGSEYETDSSWTLEDSIDTFYIDMRNQLHAFIASNTQRSFTTTHLSKSHRRYVHALAHTLGLEHASVGSKRRFRQMTITKPPPPMFGAICDLTYPEDYLSTSAPAGQMQYGELPNTGSYLPIRATSLSNMFGVNNAPEDGYETERTIRKKRKRLPKQEGGFACTFDGCMRVFDRASDRKKHEQSHQPSENRKYRCSICDKGFRYPKDLRRHGKTHGLDSATESTTASTSSMVDMTSIRQESIADSVPSLSFASQASSLDLVNTWLDASTTSQLEDFSNLTNDLEWTNSKVSLAIFQDVEEEIDAGESEDEFLEMARVNRLCLDDDGVC